MINEKFEKYYEFLVSENEKYNLTAITEYDEVEVKHFLDSLALDKFESLDNLSICDVGSGAGFPGIPLKIMHPSINLTIVEPTLKRCNFLRELCKILEIDATIINGRAENMKELRGKFDIVCARAVARLNILLELCSPMCKVNGLFIAYKGISAKEEIDEAKNASRILKMKLKNVYTYELRNNYGTRNIIEYEKIDITPTIYPRMYSKIKKDSL